MNTPYLVWFRWAGDNSGDNDTVVFAPALQVEDAKEFATEDANLPPGLEDASPVYFDGCLYVEENEDVFEEDGLSDAHWDLIVFGPDHQLFWDFVTGDVEANNPKAFGSPLPHCEKKRIVSELQTWCEDSTDDAKHFLAKAMETWRAEGFVPLLYLDLIKRVNLGLEKNALMAVTNIPQALSPPSHASKNNRL